MTLWLRITAAASACLINAASCFGSVFVDARAPGPVHDGRSWPTAFQTISEGLNAAGLGGEVWVKSGVYRECVTVGGYVRLYGGFLGHEASPADRIPGAFRSVIDAAGKGRALDVQSGGTVVVDGFRIINGRADRGAGIRCRTNSNAAVRNCVISRCEADEMGGGVYYAPYSQGQMEDCAVIDNQAVLGGGVVVEYHSYPTISNTVIARSHAAQDGGGLHCPFHSGAYLVRCTLAFNSADSRGGGAYADYGGPVTFDHCIIAFNTAAQGGGVYGDGLTSQVSIDYCDLYGSTVGDLGGALADAPVGTGNFSADPLFIAPQDDEFHLLSGSPCGGVGAYPLSAVYELARIGTAKRLPDGCVVAFAGKVVSGDDDVITYLQEPDRCAAIGVTGLAEASFGDVVSRVEGELATDEFGSRVLLVSSADVCEGVSLQPQTVGVRMSCLPYLTGVYARTWGRVETASQHQFTISDGGFQLTVDLNDHGLQPGDFAAVDGVFTGTGQFKARGGFLYQ